GAKLTGAGFGGACVALCHEGMAREAGRRVLAAYSGEIPQPAILVPPARTC
ncbi:MAG: hypothetical protein ACM3SS_21615, partial [Rhodospirillaceae bacterium]